MWLFLMFCCFFSSWALPPFFLHFPPFFLFTFPFTIIIIIIIMTITTMFVYITNVSVWYCKLLTDTETVFNTRKREDM